MRTSSAPKSFIALTAVQGFFYLLMGGWPLVHIRSFEAISGEKYDNLPSTSHADHWLVFTVGMLLCSIGAAFLVASWRGNYFAEIICLGVTAPISLAVVDVIYALRDVISEVYLIDAAIEISFIIAWIALLKTASRNQ